GAGWGGPCGLGAATPRPQAARPCCGRWRGWWGMMAAMGPSTFVPFSDQYLRSLPMPELRKDPIVGRWVIIATDRAKRPLPIRAEMPPGDEGPCPFCEGSEQETPNEILAYRDRNSQPNTRGWRVRVVPNKYPALPIEGDL